MPDEPNDPRRPGDPDDERELDLGASSESPVRSSRPMAIGGTPRPTLSDDDDDALEDRAPTWETPAAPEQARAGGVDEADRPMLEFVVGGLGLLLAAMTFLPWYTSGAVSASGWASGAWGPVVLALGLLAATIVGLRRMNISISFPVHTALLLEIIGWLAVAGLLVKLVYSPRIGSFEMDVTWWLRGALVVSLGIALAGGSVSQGVAVALRPNAFADTAGRLGVGLIVVLLGVGGLFGFTNTPSLTGAPGGQSQEFEPGYPECASNIGYPVPNGVTPTAGGSQGSGGFCIAQLETSVTRGVAMKRYHRVLKEEGWNIVYDSRKDKSNPLSQIQARHAGDCGSITIARAAGTKKKVSVTLIIGPPQIACNLGEKLKQQRKGSGS